jgi:sarcosine oxidase
VLERGVPGTGQSAGTARGFRHLHATLEQIAEAVRARSGWDAWSARAGEPLVGDEGALRLGGDAVADAAHLRAAGVEAKAVESAGTRHPALSADAGPLLWDPRGGAIRAELAIGWLWAQLGDRVQRVAVRAVDAGAYGAVALDAEGGTIRARHVVLAVGAGLVPLRGDAATFRRVVHLRITFAMPAAGWSGATWADRSGRFGALTYGVADGPGRFALGLADLDAEPAFDDPGSDAVPRNVNLSAVRERLLAYAAAAFPGLGKPVEEVVRLLTVLPGGDEDAYRVDVDGRLVIVLGHNLFKLAPLLGEKVADAITVS